jgi:hypothetical protein
MGLSLNVDGWNIRQIVHHIADTDILFAEDMKVALSSPGMQTDQPRPVGNDRISTQPEYRDRPVATSLALFRTFHEHILDILQYIPDAEERYVEHSGGHVQPFSFRQMIHQIVGHSGEHIDEIGAIRRKHGK